MNSSHLIRHAFVNRLQTLGLLLFIAGYLALLGYLFWGRDGIVLAALDTRVPDT